MDRQTKRHLARRGIGNGVFAGGAARLSASSSTDSSTRGSLFTNILACSVAIMPEPAAHAKSHPGADGADFFRWFHERVMGFDSREYRRRFWRSALSRGRTIGPMPRTAVEFTDPRLHSYNEWIMNLAFLGMAMGAAAVVWWLALAVDAHVRRLRRPTYYAAERARRMALADERRRIRRRRTSNPCPTPDALRDAFARARGSAADMIRFGSMLEDLECYVDNSIVWSETEGRIVGRRGGIRQWLRENAPELSERYKTVMKYKALAKRFRQAVGVSDPVPASAVLPPTKADEEGMHKGNGEGAGKKGRSRRNVREYSSEQSRAAVGVLVEKARERAGVLLGRCEDTVASLAAQLERVLSPEYVGNGDDENTVRTKISAKIGRRSSA